MKKAGKADYQKETSEQKHKTPAQKEKALLLDATYTEFDKESRIILYCANEEGRFWIADAKFHPYLYVAAGNEEAKKTRQELLSYTFGGNESFAANNAEETSAEMKGKPIIKVSFNRVAHLIAARKILSELGYTRYEYDIPYAKRYLLDKRLEPGNWIEYNVVEKEEINASKKLEVGANTSNKTVPITGNANSDTKKFFGEEEDDSIKINAKVKLAENISSADGPFEGKGVAFDLETKVGKKFTIGGEPILMVSIVANDLGLEKGKKQNYERVMSYGTKKIPNLEILPDEKALIEKTIFELDKPENCFIITYNGDNFDFAYTKERAKKLGVKFEINKAPPIFRRRGQDNAVKLNGLIHIDAFQIIKFLERTQAINLTKLDLENVSDKVFGEPKEKVYPKEITEAWEGKDAKKLARLVDYNLKDSRVAFRIAKEFLPMFVELSKLTSQTLYETTRSTTSQLVEDLLLKEAHQRKIIAPNKPKEGEVTQRTQNPIKGAFVKEPLAGLHENIAVLDFASLYPSIITSHNISPDTLNCIHEECKKNISPDGTWFCTKEKGLFPEILERLLKQRLALKREYKKKKKDGIEDKVLFAKQWALKIILNSVYGYLGYPRARWYSRECASATTAWEREYIHDTIKKSEKAGFKVLYGDTDSNFLLMQKKTKKDVEEFVEEVNSKLPEGMELEIDGFYKRGIFVTKKEGNAAKKRYALMDEKGNLKIVGLEYVRRDWCMLARETQKKVLEFVLSQGKPQDAIAYVKEVLAVLKEGKAQKKDLVILTVLQREPKDYTSKGPHVAAAEKAIARGKEVEAGTMLGFIITKGGKGKETISQKAELEEFVKEGDYDANYYIENQVLPAILKIIQEFGYSKEDLITGGKQTGLNAWG